MAARGEPLPGTVRASGEALPVKQAGTLQARFALQEGQTWYVRLGNWPVGGSALGLLGLACARWRVKRTPR